MHRSSLMLALAIVPSNGRVCRTSLPHACSLQRADRGCMRIHKSRRERSETQAVRNTSQRSLLRHIANTITLTACMETNDGASKMLFCPARSAHEVHVPTSIFPAASIYTLAVLTHLHTFASRLCVAADRELPSLCAPRCALAGARPERPLDLCGDCPHHSARPIQHMDECLRVDSLSALLTAV